MSATDVIRRLEQLDTRRAQWLDLWQDVSDYVLPNRGDFPNEPNSLTIGERRTLRIFDSTAVWANEQFAAGFTSFVVSPTEQWFDLSTGDQELDELPDVRRWLQEVREVITSIFNAPQSNFYSSMHELALDIGGFGTANMMIESRNTGFPVRYSTYPLAECRISEGPDGKVDTLYRVYRQSGKQLLDKYGKEKLPEKAIEKMAKDPFCTFEVVHAIEPRVLRDPMKEDKFNMAISSMKVLKDYKHLLEESGYNEFPVASSRWVLVSGEEYGRSPALNAMPDIKMTNAMQETVLKGAQKRVDPPLQMPDEGFLMPIKMNPAALNFYDAGGLGKDERITPILTGSDPGLGLDIIDSRREHIMRTFFVDLMQLQKDVEMTATEVLQRREDRMRLMAPMVTRFQHETLDTIISRTFNIALRKGLISDPPAEIEGVEIRYVSQVARAQKATRLFEFQRFLESMAAVAQFKPEVLDKLNGDGAFEFAHKLLDAPMEIMLPEEQVNALRRSREQQESAAQQAESLGNLAPYLKAINEQQVE